MIKYIAVVALTIALPLCYRMASAEAPPPSARDNRIEALKAKIADAESTAEKIEMERELAFLWLGEGSNEAVNVERFLREADRILGEYKGVSHHYSYLSIKVTCAQLQTPEIRQAMLMEVIEFDPREFMPPSGGDAVYWINRLKQGAVWAYLNGAITDAVTASLAVRARRGNEEADALARRMSATEEGRRCIPFAEWWRAVTTAQAQKAIPIPKVADPPPSRWSEMVAAMPADTAEAAIEPNEEEISESPQVVPVRAKRTFDTIECIGEFVPPATQSAPTKTPLLPWAIGSLGVVLLAIGIVSRARKPKENAT